MQELHYCITGSNGFSGLNVAKFLCQKNKKVLGLSKKRKITKLKNFKYLSIDLKNNFYKKIKNYKIDWFVHAAAHHKIKDFSKNAFNKGLNNEKMVKNIIDVCKKKEIKNLIFFSTIDINYKPQNPLKKIYIRSKLNSEKYLIDCFKKGYLDKLIIFRLPAIIGKNCNDNFLKKSCENLSRNKDITIWNSNKNYDNFVHIDDIKKLVLKISEMKKTFFFDIIECKCSKPIKLKNLMNFLKKRLKSKSKIKSLKATSLKRIKNIKDKTNYKFLTPTNALEKFLT
jgi:nucleoside-diphosphate-sugar epimerase